MPAQPKLDRLDLNADELRAIIRKKQLSDDECTKLLAVVDTLTLITQELDNKKTSIMRLRKMIFGATTEKTAHVRGGQANNEASKDKGEDNSSALSHAAPNDPDGSSSTGADPQRDSSADKPKRKGHGRTAAKSYTGAEQIRVEHPSLSAGDSCPLECGGKVYPFKPVTLVRLHGRSPIAATVFTMLRYRCNLCQKIFAAQKPPNVGPNKYDAEAVAMTGLLKYCTGLPFNRLDGLQSALEVPLPASTQWDIVSAGATKLAPAFDELVRHAAAADVLYNDDTPAKVLSLMGRRRPARQGDDKTGRERTGMFTTGVIAETAQAKIALFFTGQKHAGENLGTVLAHRDAALGPPIHMCDALSRNLPADFQTILANCMAHARRQFVEVESSFPDECRYLLEQLGKVYSIDAKAKQDELTDEQRLIEHVRHSAPIMDELKAWMSGLLDNKMVEPNSGLGDAIQYMLDHWAPLTRFLSVAGAPIDNNICERALKKAILHRKNSLFFRSARGAKVADIFMSLGYTAQLNNVNPFRYLVTLLEHAARVIDHPSAWMPWNYTVALDTALAA